MKAVYVYGVMDAQTALPPLRGIQESSLQAWRCGSLQIIFSEIDLDALPPMRDDENLKRAVPLILQHEQVISQLLSVGGVLPMTFGTVLHDLAGLEASQLAAWQEDLTHLADCVEMGIRVSADDALLPMPAPLSRTGQSGLEYMRQRKAHLDAKMQRETLLNQALQALHEALHNQARCSLLKDQDGVLLRAIYLIGRDQQTAFQALLQAQAERFPFLHIQVDGPFAPYHFVGGAYER